MPEAKTAPKPDLHTSPSGDDESWGDEEIKSLEATISRAERVLAESEAVSTRLKATNESNSEQNSDEPTTEAEPDQAESQAEGDEARKSSRHRKQSFGRRLMALFGHGEHSTHRKDEESQPDGKSDDQAQSDEAAMTSADYPYGDKKANRREEPTGIIIPLDPLHHTYTGGHRPEQKPGRHRKSYIKAMEKAEARQKAEDKTQPQEQPDKVDRSADQPEFNFKPNDQVRVLRDSGELEDGWRVLAVTDNGVRVFKELGGGEAIKSKSVTHEELTGWQFADNDSYDEHTSDKRKFLDIETLGQRAGTWLRVRNRQIIESFNERRASPEEAKKSRRVLLIGGAAVAAVGAAMYLLDRNGYSVSMPDWVPQFGFGEGSDSAPDLSGGPDSGADLNDSLDAGVDLGSGSEAIDSPDNRVTPVEPLPPSGEIIADPVEDQPVVAAAAPETGEVTTLLEDQFTASTINETSDVNPAPDSKEIFTEDMPSIDKGEGIISFAKDEYGASLNNMEALELGEELHENGYAYSSEYLKANFGNQYGLVEPGQIDQGMHEIMLDYTDDGEFNQSHADVTHQTTGSVDPSLVANIESIVDKGSFSQLNDLDVAELKLDELTESLKDATYSDGSPMVGVEDGNYVFKDQPNGATINNISTVNTIREHIKSLAPDVRDAVSSAFDLAA